ncbi:MAG TPA: NAD(P)-binding domain-containing protein [Blastocatellia bacterium]|nr:NAD(P)-binding domain-containing protein [Blastocatellia bacterium]
MLDLIIIGSGPAGLSAALAAKELALSYLVLERGTIADTVHLFPLRRKLFSTANELELEAGAFAADYKPSREELLKHYVDLATREGINIRTGEEAHRIEPINECLLVGTSRGEYRARAVLAALGGFGRPRTLNVPGEGLPCVTYRFVEPLSFRDKKVLVVGGGNSAAEAALSLAEAGTRVTLALRRPALGPHGNGGAPPRTAAIKPWVLAPLEEKIAAGQIRLICSAEVRKIEPGRVLLRLHNTSADGELESVECDQVFALIGADPDTRLLETAGALIGDDRHPIYDPETYETTVPGLYVAGHLTRERHIKNAVVTSRRVVRNIAAQLVHT